MKQRMTSNAHLPATEGNVSDQRAATKKFLLLFNLGLLTLLTLFGTEFSKFQLYGPLYLHDFLLVLGSGLALLLLPRRFPFWPVNTVLVISVGYFAYSFYRADVGSSLIIRQFALFAYMACCYLLNRSWSDEHSGLIERFLIFFSYAAIILQTLLIVYLFVFRNLDPTNSHNHYWYSPATVVGLIVAAAVILIHAKSIAYRIVLSIYLIFLCWTTGHASAILAVMSILGTYGILLLRGWKKWIPIAGIVFLIGALMSFAPQFRDKNTDWRILTWEYLLTDLATDKYMVLGNGFGTPYFSKPLEELLYARISSTAMLERGKPDERYLSPPHNSFLTIMFSIGILPGLLIFAPYIFIAGDLQKTIEEISRRTSLFMLVLIGLSVWVAFNVVLELPHSAGFFWLAYFTYWGLRAPVAEVDSLSRDSFSNQKAP